MSTLRKRLATVEERIELQRHRELQRQFKGTARVREVGLGFAPIFY